MTNNSKEAQPGTLAHVTGCRVPARSHARLCDGCGQMRESVIDYTAHAAGYDPEPMQLCHPCAVALVTDGARLEEWQPVG